MTSRTKQLLALGAVLTVALATMAPAARGPIQPRGITGLARIVYADSILGFDATTAIVPHVSGNAVKDTATGLWHYSYTLRNDPASDNAIRYFAVSPIPGRPASVLAPAHWTGYYGFDADSNAVAWTTADAQDPPVGWDSLSTYPSIYDVQPGDSVSFSFVHTLGPVMVTYFVQGFFYPDTSAESTGPVNPSIFSSSVTGSVIGPSALAGVGERPGSNSFELGRARPNPARGRVAFAFYLPRSGVVRLSVYDVAGRKVKTIVDALFGAGYHSVEWDARGDGGEAVRPGVYFYRLFVNGRPVAGQRVTILR
jgi:hypothetical protein